MECIPINGNCIKMNLSLIICYQFYFRAQDYGYTRMTAFNKTHLYFEQVSDEQNGKVIDSVFIIKTQTVPSYAKLNRNIRADEL